MTDVDCQTTTEANNFQLKPKIICCVSGWQVKHICWGRIPFEIQLLVHWKVIALWTFEALTSSIPLQAL